MDDKEFYNKINDNHKRLIDPDYNLDEFNQLWEILDRKQKENDNRLIKKGIQIALNELEKLWNESTELWVFSDVKNKLEELLEKEDFDY